MNRRNLFFVSLKRFIAVLLLVCAVTTAFPSGKMEVRADSNDLRSLYIQLMSGRDLTQLEEVDKLTVDDLRVLALFLSNFYVPWETVIDGAPDTDNDSKVAEATEKTKKGMVDILKALGYKTDVAEQVIDACFQATVSSAQKIYVDSNLAFGFTGVFEVVQGSAQNSINNTTKTTREIGSPFVTSKTYKDEDYVTFVGGVEDGKTPATVFQWNIGAACKNSKAAVLNEDGYTECNEVAYYWNDGGTWRKVWEWNKLQTDIYLSFMQKGKGITDYLASQKSGYFGNAFATYGISSGAIKDESKISDDLRPAICSLTQIMYVDWVGNIVADLGRYRVIVVPACANAYTFSKITTSEGRSEDGTCDTFNMISTRGLRTLYFRGSYNESSKEYALRSISGSTKYTDENYDSLKMNMIWGIGSKKVANSWDTNTWTLTNWKNLAKKSEGGAWYIWLGGIGVQKGGVVTTKNTTVIPPKTTETKSYSFVDLATKELFFETEPNKAFGCINYDDDESYPLTIKYEIVSGLNSKNSLNQLIYYDSANLNKYNNLDSESVFNIVDFCDGNITKEKYFANDSGFTSVNTGSNFQQNMVGFSGTSKQVLCSIYLTYVFAYNNTGATEFDKSKHYVDMKFNDIFPKANASDITWDTTASVDNKIMSWIYYLLNPGEGQKYISTWFKTKVGGIFLGWHESIVGSGSSNVTTGSTRYLGMSGYATTPALTDVEWVTRGLSAYSSIVVYILIFMALVLLCYLLMGSLSIQRAVLGFIIFGVCVFVPPVAITATTDMINRVCDSLYSNKFEFWAICQCQTYIDKLDTLTDAGQSGNSFDYYSALIDATAEYGGVEDSSGGFSGAKLKWMSPKKFNELVELGNELDSALMNGYANYGTTASLLTNMISNATSGETYIDTATATYLYRDFLDIYRYSSSFSQQNHMRSLDAI